MSDKIRSMIVTATMAIILFGTAAWCWMRTPDEYSSAERRRLAVMPELSADKIADGSFMSEFESYAADQFPMRDNFRSIKAFSEYNFLRKLDNNGLYAENGYISEIEYPLNETMLDHAAERFRYIYDTYITENNRVYFSLVPDKNCHIAKQSGRLSLDYDELTLMMRDKTSYMQYIDITGFLEAEDYYRTDTHWRQERIVDIAQHIAHEMGTEISGNFEYNELDHDFHGVYSGQYALEAEPDKLVYLTNDAIDGCTVKSYSTGSPVTSVVYNMEKSTGRDPYEMFLSGSEPLLVIENPSCKTGKRLIMFRDSFASSLAPLLIEGYSEITLVDIRYIQSSALGNFINFEDQDVLFMYSAILMNNSLALR